MRSKCLLAVVATLVSHSCIGSEDPLPPLADSSYETAIRRGARAPDPDSLREAVVRDYLLRLPSEDSPVVRAPRELCTSVEPQEASLQGDFLFHVQSPEPCPLHDPQSSFIDRFQGTRVRVVPATKCSEALAGLEMGPILRWSAHDLEFEILADVFLLPVGYVRAYSAVHTSGRWSLV